MIVIIIIITIMVVVKTVCIWDLRAHNRDPIQSLSDFTDSVTSVAHTPSDIVTGNCVFVWWLVDNCSCGRLDRHDASGCVDGHLRTFDMRNGKQSDDHLRDPILSVALTYDLKCVVSATLGGVVHLTSLKTGQQLQTYEGHCNDSFKTQACVSSDDAHILCGSEDGSVYHWTLLGGAVTHRTLKVHERPISALAYHPSKPIYLTASYDGTAKCFETRYA